MKKNINSKIIINKTVNVLKIILLLIFPILVSIRLDNICFFFSALLLIVSIFGISILLHNKQKRLANFVNGILCFLFCIQYLVKYFANSYISMQMVTNLDSLEDISGKFYIYIPCVLLCILICFITVNVNENKSKKIKGVIIACIIGATCINFTLFKEYNPYYAYYELIVQKNDLDLMKEKIHENNSLNVADSFYKERIGDYIKSDFNINRPNVILIFTEGFSQNIVEDERNITPNIRELEKSSINFINYYNHTFATYMGLSGQLYSGFQQNNYDDNQLISLQDIMKVNGYNTYFINTEPKNEDFSNYLANMRFDEIITQNDNLNGMCETVSDKDAYDLLFDTAKKKEAESPFLLGIYTFGTHVNLDSVDLKYGSGKNTMLNRVYNNDYYLGEFISKFNESSLADNTILIFTTDHASYEDQDYIEAFPEYKRESTMIDKIPLCIYYKGIKPREVDVNGKNSLDLTPTVCDYLDLEGENYFLGISLFAPCDEENFYDTKFQSKANYFQTENSKICNIDDVSILNKFKEQVAMYFSAKLLDESIHEEYLNSPKISVYQDRENLCFEINNIANMDLLRIAVWSIENDQDDLKWYSYDVDEENDLFQVSLIGFKDIGEYCCDVYGYNEKQEEVFLGRQCLSISILPIYCEANEINQTLELKLYNALEWYQFSVAVWNLENEQNDIQWYILDKDKYDDEATFKIDLRNFENQGEFVVHIYGKRAEKEEFISEKHFILNDV